MARLLIVFLVLGAACAPRRAEEPAVVRTADPVKRGLSEADFPRTRQIAPGVYTYEALRSAGNERFTTVSLFVVTPQGVLVADGQGSVTETGRMIDSIAAITELPITHVVICSDHGDHTGGNAAFPRSATFLAHPTSQAVLRSPTAPPMNAVIDRTVIQLGGREIHVRFLGRAHTGGDLMVYLPKEKVLFMSEAYLNRVFPAMRSAYPSEWVATIDQALRLDVDVFVPGHGFVESPGILRQELGTFREALVQVIAEARRLHAAGVPVEEAVAQARFGELETWSLRSSQGAIAIRRVYQELAGALR